MSPKISIIIPVYNAAKYLRECLNSVLQQTLQEIEIVCIDDGSTDNSYEILKEYAAEDSRFQILQQENCGAGVTRNRGIEAASGEFVAFLDADDFYLDSSALNLLYKKAKEANVFVVGAFRQHISPSGEIRKHPLYRRFCENTQEGMKCRYIDFQYDYHYHSYIYCRNFLKKNALFFPSYQRFQDPPFFVKAMFAADFFVVVPVEFYAFRESERSDAHFDAVKAHDLLQGLNENLFFSKQHRLAILHWITANRFVQNFFFAVVDNLSEENFDLIKLLCRADSLLDSELLQKVQDKISELSFLDAMELGDLPQLSETFFSSLPGNGAVRVAFLLREAKERNCLYKLLECERNRFIEEQERLILKQKAFIEEREILQNKYHALANEVRIIQHSFSYRLGNMLTWLPRKIYGLFYR